MDFPVAFCEELIGGPSGFWPLAETNWAACMRQEPLRRWQAELHDALIVRHAPADGWQILQAAMAWLAGHLPDQRPLYTACALGALLPEAVAYYQMLGTPAEILRATFADMARWIEVYGMVHGGAYGVDEISWLIHPYAGTIFEIGCLQFQTFINPFPIFAYADATGAQLLPAAGLAVDATGHLCGTNGGHGTPAFHTQLTVKDGLLCGNRIDQKAAVILPETRCLPAGQLVLAPYQPALNLHIPRGADLSAVAIDASFGAAKAFFTALGYPCRAAVCDSWLLDPTVAEYQPSGSRIAAFSHRFQRFPVGGPHASFGRFLFGYDFDPQNLANLVPHSALQQKVQHRLLNGGEMFDTGGVVLL